MRILYKIKGEPLTVQCHIVVILVFLVSVFIYVTGRIIELVTGQKTTLTKPSFEEIAIKTALAIPEVSPANRDNIIIYIN